MEDEEEKTIWLDETINTPYGEFQMYKLNESDRTIWIEADDYVGLFLFTLDKKKIYNLFSDYPYNMSKEDIEIFSKENPYWRKFFADRFI